MMDKLSAADRSKNMSAIKSRNTKPEMLFRKWIFSRGYRYRVNAKYIPGRPDLFLRKHNTAVFVNGCFWHRHKKCKFAYTPKSNVEFWLEKFKKNIERDEQIKDILKKKGIKQLIIWECTIKEMEKDDAYKNYILSICEDFFDHNEQYLEI